MKRILAHKIIFEGREYSFSILEFNAPDHIRIMPYTGEVYGTEFYNGTVKVKITPEGELSIIDQNRLR